MNFIEVTGWDGDSKVTSPTCPDFLLIKFVALVKPKRGLNVRTHFFVQFRVPLDQLESVASEDKAAFQDLRVKSVDKVCLDFQETW